jgi:hypothetical protein
LTEEEYFWGQDMELSPTVWIIIVSSVVVFWILLAAFLACFCGPNFVECHLCEQQVHLNGLDSTGDVTGVNMHAEQGDQFGRIFAYCVSVYFG